MHLAVLVTRRNHHPNGRRVEMRPITVVELAALIGKIAIGEITFGRKVSSVADGSFPVAVRTAQDGIDR